jgi:hypothetical protein
MAVELHGLGLLFGVAVIVTMLRVATLGRSQPWRGRDALMKLWWPRQQGLMTIIVPLSR